MYGACIERQPTREAVRSYFNSVMVLTEDLNQLLNWIIVNYSTRRPPFRIQEIVRAIESIRLRPSDEPGEEPRPSRFKIYVETDQNGMNYIRTFSFCFSLSLAQDADCTGHLILGRAPNGTDMFVRPEILVNLPTDNNLGGFEDWV